MDATALERLEERELLSYSTLGYSLPDLQVSGLAGPVAAWGGTFQVTVILENTGASTINEPLSLVPVTQVGVGPDGLPVPPYVVPSSADAAASKIAVLISPQFHSLIHAVQIATIDAPALTQNNLERFDVPLVLPQRPAGFPGAGGKVYIRLVANFDHAILESNFANNVSSPLPVRIASQSLPSLTASAFDVPPVMQPGDTIQPVIQIANLGTAGTSEQGVGPVQVALVASVTHDFGQGSSIVALYTVSDIPSQSSTPLRPHIRSIKSVAVNNVTPNRNVATITGTPVTLPTSPSKYALGVVIDPFNKLNQIPQPGNCFQLAHVVGPPIHNLPPAGVVSSPLTQPFPNPPDGIPIGIVGNS
jgi:hypothetical protein